MNETENNKNDENETRLKSDGVQARGEGENADSHVPNDVRSETTDASKAQGDKTERSRERRLSAEEEDNDDAFFSKSFAINSESRDSERDADHFADGLRSLFADSDDEDDEEDDVEEENEGEANRENDDVPSLSEVMEKERRESIDGVLRQDDADFLAASAEKYDVKRDETSTLSSRSSDEPQESNADATATSERRAKINPESILEAALFVGDRDNKPLTLKRACELMRNVSELEAMEALADLNERYYRDGSPYKIVRDGDGFRLTLLPEYQDFISHSDGKTKEFKMSQTAIDVLALVAYRQPIAREEILDARSNASGVLAQLLKRDLISREERVVDKKKVIYYSTTERFLTLFNLKSLDDLPIMGDVDIR